MKALIEHVLERNKDKSHEIKTAVLGDSAYDSNKNFKHLQMKRIIPGIKIRKILIISSKNNKKSRSHKSNKRSSQMEKEKNTDKEGCQCQW
jgi:hypothetical protein